MELRELRYFLAVYETGSVTAAARRCFISQPSISAALAALERELGEILSTRVAVEAGPKGRGKLVIHYHDADALEGILDKLR